MPDPNTAMLNMMQQFLLNNDVDCDAPELHGIFTGLVCSGSGDTLNAWQAPIQDLLNDGVEFDRAVQKTLADFHAQIVAALKDTDMGFTILIPEDEESLNERAIAIVQWVQGFLIGFSLAGKKMVSFSDDVKEVLDDFSEITKLDTDMEANEQSEQAMFEIIEYVKVSVLLCFNECSRSFASHANTTSDRLH